MTEKAKTRAAKHQEIKKSTQRTLGQFLPQFFVFVFVSLLTAGIFILDRPDHVANVEFLLGEPAPRTLFSPFKIIYTNEKESQLRAENAAKAVPPAFVEDPKVTHEIAAKLQAFFTFLSEAGKTSVVGSALKPDEPSKVPIEISESTLKALLETHSLQDVRKQIEVILERNYSQGIMASEKKSELVAGGTNTVSLIFPDQKSEKKLPALEITTEKDLLISAERIFPESLSSNLPLRNAILDVLKTLAGPNLFFDEELTKERRKKAVEALSPVTEEIKKDELIVQRGMLVSVREKEKIARLQKELAERRVWNQFFSSWMICGVGYFFCFLYLYLFLPKTLQSKRSVGLILVVFAMTVVFSKIVAIWPGSSHYLMPTALAALLLTLLLEPAVGILTAFCMTVILAPLAQYSAPVVLGILTSGIAATMSSLRLRKRSQFVKVGAAIGLSYGTIIFAFGVAQNAPVFEALQEAALALTNGLLITAPLCFLLLPVFENLFDLTTDVSLLELSDLNHPLLKKMIVEAPGTYHHSLVVSTLAESASERIGANALLARVGCYFHDIGKIARAEFFTENVADKNISKHGKLTPNMSSLVILNHVKDGIELGRQFKLKKRILDFIPEHQGTGVVYYFYKKALDSARPGDKINADDYRYPGPKPQSRETAIAMLADSTEAASRTLKEPSPESIRQLVRKIINDKFIDGQLDECNLSLKDLHKIQESFVYNLMAIFHTRINYPQGEAKPNRPDLFNENPPTPNWVEKHPEKRSE